MKNSRCLKRRATAPYEERTTESVFSAVGVYCEPLTFAYSTRTVTMDESTFNGMCAGPKRWLDCEYRE